MLNLSYQAGARKLTLDGVRGWRPTIWFTGPDGVRELYWEGAIIYQTKEQAAEIAIDRLGQEAFSSERESNARS